MAAANHSSSKRPQWASSGLVLLVLAGCSTGGALLGKDLRLFTFDDGGGIAEAAPMLKPSIDDTVVASTDLPKVVPVMAEAPRSHWCDYLREDTLAQTTIMRSPTLGGTIKDDASASVSLGLSANSFLKASLLEEASEIKCQKYLAEAGLQKLVFVSKDSLTASGYKARYKFIAAQKSEIVRLRRKTATLLNSGALDQERATQINVLADSILADGESSRSETERRIEDVLSVRQSAATYGSALLQAESELEAINSRIRSIEAFDVTASVGWNDDVNASGVDVNDQSFSGKINLSMKLGALNPRRFEHEEAAKNAKLRAITSEEGGAIWQANTLHRAHERAIDGLEQQRGQIDAAIRKAEKLAELLVEASGLDFEPPLIQVKLQLIKLKADRAAVAQSVADIRINMTKLKSG